MYLLKYFPYSPLSSTQLLSVLVALSADSPDFGDDIIKHLVGQSSIQQVQGGACQTSVSPVALDLVLGLCRPTTDSNKQR